jgi:hypothetical protein
MYLGPYQLRIGCTDTSNTITFNNGWTYTKSIDVGVSNLAIYTYIPPSLTQTWCVEIEKTFTDASMVALTGARTFTFQSALSTSVDVDSTATAGVTTFYITTRTTND